MESQRCDELPGLANARLSLILILVHGLILLVLCDYRLQIVSSGVRHCLLISELVSLELA